MGTLFKTTLLLALLVKLSDCQATNESTEAIPTEEFPLTCIMVKLCAEFRERVLKDYEIYNITSFEFKDGILHFTVFNDMFNQLNMVIASVENDTFRLKIFEPDEHRYEIQHTLEKAPIYRDLELVSSNDTTLVAKDDYGNSIVANFRPLEVQFYRKNSLEIVFNGSRLIMENDELSQSFAFSLKFTSNRLTGLFEHSAPLSLLQTVDTLREPYRLKNLDHGHYEFNNTEPLYGSIPLIYGLGNVTSGVFLHNAAEMWIDIDNGNQSAYFMVNSGLLDLFIFTGPTLKHAVRQYTSLTGKAHMPQLWTLGYHQSRYSYKTEEEVKEIVENFDKYNFPVDAVWLDIDYTDGYRYFTWNYTEFPDPIGLLDWVDSQANRKIVTISDPHIKIDTNYSIYITSLENGYFINGSDGEPYNSSCWPGDSNWIDFLNPNARDYYASLHSYSNFKSTPTLAGFWNDMNEPATFDDSTERTFPSDAVHYGGVTHGDIHNMYGFLQVIATHQGLMERDNGTRRPFILSRSFFAGAQRYTAKWAGDTGGSFVYQRTLVPMALSANLAGLVFYGADIPGFTDDPTDELATRWYQIGAWIPFYRAHGDLDSKHREPWVFSSETQGYIRESIQTRYKHLPYWYTLFYEHTISGDPIIRPLFYQYPNDDVALDLYDEFLVGSNVLVANVYFTNATSLDIYLPNATDYWFLVTGDSHRVYKGGQWVTIPVDLSFIPVFYKYGSIITRKATVGRSTEEMLDNLYEIHVLVDLEDKLAETTVYIDDFKTFEYLNNNSYAYFTVAYIGSNDTLTTTLHGGDNINEEFSFNIETVVVYIRSDNGTYTVQSFHFARDGTPLKNINLLKTHVQLSLDQGVIIDAI